MYAETAQRTYEPEGMKHATSIEKAYGGQLIEVASKSAVKRYEDFTAISDTSSRQYKLLQEGELQPNGLISINGYVCAALGSRYGQIGDKFTFVLEKNGRRHSVKVIMADQKQDKHTAGGNGLTDKDGNIMELIVCTGQLPEAARTSGDCDKIEAVCGEIVKIIKESNK